jgi:hypothetical protein
MAENGIRYLLDEVNFVYNPDLNYTSNPEEQKLLEKPIGYYGRAWMTWMETYYPRKIANLQMNCRWQIIPRQIDKEAGERYEQMDKEWKANNPRPKTFTEIQKWETERHMTIDHTVMTEMVCQLRD